MSPPVRLELAAAVASAYARAERATRIVAVVLCVASLASAEARPAAFGEPFTGAEPLFVETALVPVGAVRRDLNGTQIPGGVRLGWWANVSSASALDGRVRVVTSFRLDLDNSATSAEKAAFPFLEQKRFAVMAAYLEYDATRTLSLRAGRQFQADLADWLAFDGGRVTWRLAGLPFHLEAYGGVRASLGITQGTVASALYELDGVPAIQGTQPLVGATLRYTGALLKRSEASLGYRRSWRTSEADRARDAALPEGPYVTAEELVGSAAGDLGPVHLAVGAALEVALVRLMRARLAAAIEHEKLFAGSKLDATYSLELQRYQPTFALDSIWNYFSARPYDEAALAGVVRGPERTRLEARAWVRLFHSATEDARGSEISISPGTQPASGARAGVVRQFGSLLADAFVGGQAGFGGRRVLLDSGLSGPLADAVTGYVRVTILNFAQDLQPAYAGNALGMVAGASWRLPGGASASIVIEESLSAFASPVPRIYGLVDFARWL